MQINEIFALDLGTTKFCLAALRKTLPSGELFLDAISVNAKGMSKGMVASFDEVINRIQLLINNAEKHFGMSIDKVTLGIAGSHLKSRIVKTTVTLKDSNISRKTLDRLEQKVRLENAEPGREILHIIPLQYRINERQTIANPIGFCGKSLHVAHLIIDADEDYIKDLIRLCNQAHLEVQSVVAEPIASASVTLSPTLGANGAVLIDIGGGTSDGMIVIDGKPFRSFTINCAGTLMTRDIALGLNLSDTEAEKCKIIFGLSRDAHTVLSITDVNGRERKITGVDVFKILAPRIDELISILYREISPFLKLIGAGVIITGGGSEVKNLAEYIEAKIKVNCHQMRPKLSDLMGETNEIIPKIKAGERELISKNSTVIGLLKFAIDQSLTSGELQNINESLGIFSRLVGWVKEHT